MNYPVSLVKHIPTVTQPPSCSCTRGSCLDIYSGVQVQTFSDQFASVWLDQTLFGGLIYSVDKWWFHALFVKSSVSLSLLSLVYGPTWVLLSLFVSHTLSLSVSLWVFAHVRPLTFRNVLEMGPLDVGLLQRARRTSDCIFSHYQTSLVQVWFLPETFDRTYTTTCLSNCKQTHILETSDKYISHHPWALGSEHCLIPHSLNELCLLSVTFPAEVHSVMWLSPTCLCTSVTVAQRWHWF